MSLFTKQERSLIFPDLKSLHFLSWYYYTFKTQNFEKYVFLLLQNSKMHFSIWSTLTVDVDQLKKVGCTFFALVDVDGLRRWLPFSRLTAGSFHYKRATSLVCSKFQMSLREKWHLSFCIFTQKTYVLCKNAKLCNSQGRIF